MKYRNAIAPIASIPEIEYRCCNDVATKYARVGPFGTAHAGGATSKDRASANDPHCVKRASIGENVPAGTRYQIAPSYETAQLVELSSYVRAPAGSAHVPHASSNHKSAAATP